MPGIQELFRIFAFVSVKSFHAGCGVTHDDHTIRDVDEILDGSSIEVPATLRVERWRDAHLAQGPTFHP